MCLCVCVCALWLLCLSQSLRSCLAVDHDVRGSRWPGVESDYPMDTSVSDRFAMYCVAEHRHGKTIPPVILELARLWLANRSGVFRCMISKTVRFPESAFFRRCVKVDSQVGVVLSRQLRSPPNSNLRINLDPT